MSLGIIRQETGCLWRHLKLNSALQIYGNRKHMCLCHSTFIVLTNGGTIKKEVHIRTVLQDEAYVDGVIS